MGSIGQLINTDSNSSKHVKEIVDIFYDNDILNIEKVLLSFNKIKKSNNDELIKFLNILKMVQLNQIFGDVVYYINMVVFIVILM